MKIETNAIYHLPTQAHEDDFLKQVEKQGLRNGRRATATKLWSNCKEEYCIRVEDGALSGWCDKTWFEATSSLPIIEWQIGFTKADMQMGQAYKMRNRQIRAWTQNDFDTYNEDLTSDNGYHPYDVVEVYPLNLTPIWKREEPKYRVKTELTKEQAEKLGLEFCEVVE